MSGHLLSRRSKWYVALGSLALAGLAWVWMSWQRAPELVSQGTSLYAQGDYQQGANLARRRLKEAADDKEALRLLARATARLGRDAAANALFARLGSDSLQAEDLFLLGIGLNRAGQKESAAHVWEKGLSLQPDHAEMIEQLMTLLSAQSAIAKAARLAERLVRQPGWEFRGELALGNFRAEMNDPAGAADVVRRALNRPEASRLDRARAVYYRELLARSLLKIERPEEARDVLQDVIQIDPDPAAYWMLSRAALQENAIPEAITAIEAAGSYRANHPLELEPGPYAGESKCVPCHAEKARAFQLSRHSSTLTRGQRLLGLPYPDQTIIDPDNAAVTHKISREQGQVHCQTQAKGNVLAMVVDYAFGSPDKYVSLVGHDTRDKPYIFRLSHYQVDHDAGWVRTTGHTPDAQGGHDFLGKPIDGIEGIYACLFCHATQPKAVLDRSGPVANDRAIGCERCHGPGGNHLHAVESKLSDLAIVNPATAPAEGRIRICGQCHSNHQESPIPHSDPYWLRFQGTTIAWSRCYTESSGSLDCMTCHNPHHDTDRTSAHHDARCLTCHSGQPAETKDARSGTAKRRNERAFRASMCPVNSATGCVGCHMPSVPIAPLHATFTDHYIRVHPGGQPRPTP
jgi:tetratricopeptide (TPR) repeat protein